MKFTLFSCKLSFDDLLFELLILPANDFCDGDLLNVLCEEALFTERDNVDVEESEFVDLPFPTNLSTSLMNDVIFISLCSDVRLLGARVESCEDGGVT